MAIFRWGAIEGAVGCRWVWKNAIFDQSGFISEMIQERVIVTMERQQELVCDILTGATFNELK